MVTLREDNYQLSIFHHIILFCLELGNEGLPVVISPEDGAIDLLALGINNDKGGEFKDIEIFGNVAAPELIHIDFDGDELFDKCLSLRFVPNNFIQQGNRGDIGGAEKDKHWSLLFLRYIPSNLCIQP